MVALSGIREMADWGNDNLSEFLEVAHGNQPLNRIRFPDEYSLLARVNACFVAAVGPALVDPKPMMVGVLFLRSQYAYKTAAGHALGGQPVEAFVMMRSCLEYAGYAAAMFADPTLESVFLSRHFDEPSKKLQKAKFQISGIREVLAGFDPRIAEKYQTLYDRTIDFGGHPNPNAAIGTMSIEANNILTLAITADEQMLKHAMISTRQMGFTSLLIFYHVFKAHFGSSGVSAEMEELTRLI